MNYILYNPLSSNNEGEKVKNKAVSELKDKYENLNEVDFTKIDFKEFAEKTTDSDNIILIGGDGTINFLANKLKKNPAKGNFYLYAGGTGNDFLNDLNKPEGLVLLNDYLKNLPKVYVNDKEMYYINNVGFGLDGVVCEIADKKKEQGKKINYTSIAITLLLFKYKKRGAKVIVDGKEYNYKKTWLAATMNGRYYGGGMEITPDQNRLGNKVSICILHKGSRLKTLFAFKSIFKGEHKKKYPKMVDIFEGNVIEVTFDTPCAIQIDGETILNVTHYKVVKGAVKK